MDPISQGIVGAVLAQSKAKKNSIIKIGVIGFMAGMAPDLDVLIKSSTDPILSLEYHRQFTHSLLFIPFGAMIVALMIFPLIKFIGGFPINDATKILIGLSYICFGVPIC